MYELFSMENSYILPNGSTFTGMELSNKTSYSFLKNHTYAVDTSGNFLKSFIALEDLKAQWDVINDDDEMAIETINSKIQIEKNKKRADVEQVNEAVLFLKTYYVPDKSPSLSDATMAKFSHLFPKWEPDHDYVKGQTIKHNSKFYRISQSHTSQDIFKPGDISTESLYYEIVIAPDGILVWHQPNGEYDSIRIGEMVHYPDADSPIYISKIDANTYSPDTYPDGWQLYVES